MDRMTTLLALGAEQKTGIAGFMHDLVGAVWSWPLIILCVGAGLVFTLSTFGIQFRAFKHAIRVVAGKFDKPGDTGEITHFQALTSALSATIGLGNIAGVAIAISLGGPGAVFWMWVVGLVGMATKFTECTLSMRYRHEFSDGHVGGGPMYTIRYGFEELARRIDAKRSRKIESGDWDEVSAEAAGSKFRAAFLLVTARPLAGIFAFLVIIASFGGGNMFQSNQAASIFKSSFGIDPGITGLVIASVVAMVIIGGIKRIGQVTSKLVPAMCLIYVVGALIIIGMNISEVPAMFGAIFSNAFSAEPLIGGTFGAVIAQGVRRATFSNEAGFGSAAIAHAAAKTDEPVREGIVASLGPFIDTLVICTMTALVIIISGGYGAEGVQGVVVTSQAFDSGIDGFGTYFIPIAVLMFSVSTVISWSYYGEKGVEYFARRRGSDVFVTQAITVYRGLFCILCFVGAVESLDLVLDFSDAMLGLMAIPNLLSCLILLGLVLSMTRKYFSRLKTGEFDIDPVPTEGTPSTDQE